MSLLLALPCYTMMQGEKILLHNFKYLFVINSKVLNAKLIILLDLSTQVKIQLAVYYEEQFWLSRCIMVFYRWWHTTKEILLAHVVRIQYPNWSTCMDGDVCSIWWFYQSNCVWPRTTLLAPSVYDTIALQKLKDCLMHFQYNYFTLLQTGPYNYLIASTGIIIYNY